MKRLIPRFLILVLFIVLALAALSDVALACPNCKEAVMADSGVPAASGFNTSILFMMSMPFVLLAVFGIRIWLSARRRAATEAR